jgi:hypothetical protein
LIGCLRRQVDQLFESIKRIDGVIGQVPLVIARLQSLQRVHEAGATFVDDFQKLQSQQVAISNLLANQSVSIKQVRILMILFGFAFRCSLFPFLSME